MTDALFALAKQVFLEVCDLPSAERQAFLIEACGADDELRREVEALLEHQLATESDLVAGTPEEPPHVEGFRFVQKIGGGGMGEVWEAEQLTPVRRQVALKLIRPGVSGEDLPARFEAERQALALMNHLNIATVLEAGTTPSGRSYFAMELVRGVPITEYCDRHRLGLRERLALFLQVCEGVQHAHHKGVIHRDIKPPNLLVTDESGEPVAKVIDFGVAKASSRRLTERTLLTEQGQWLGTPEYMSPEQAGLTDTHVDTRTDVYALGVVLYELLVGRRPFDAERLHRSGFGEMCRILREEDPPRPSARVTDLGGDSDAVAHERHTDSGTLARQLRGDLDWIVMKTLEREQDRRYGSPAELAADIGRHLRSEPVLARPPSTPYRLRKLAGRNRVAAAAILLVVVSLVAGALGTTLGMMRARREAEAAQRLAETMATVLQTLNPAAPMGPVDSARRVLERSLAEIDDKLQDQPVVRGRLLTVIGQTYNNLGAFDEARTVLETAQGLWDERLWSNDAALGDLYTTLGWNQFFRGRLDAARASFERAVDIHERASGDDSAATGWALANFGVCLWRVGEYERSRATLDRAERILTTRFGADSGAIASTLHFKGMLLSYVGEFQAAKSVLERSVAIYERELGQTHAAIVRPVAELARAHLLLGERSRAERLFRRALEIGQTTFGKDHFVNASPLRELGALEARRGNHRLARGHLRRALEIEERSLGPNHPDLVWTLRLWGRALSRAGDHEGARARLERALVVAEAGYGPEHVEVAASLEALGYNEHLLEHPRAARSYYQRAQTIRLKVLGPRNRWTGRNWYQQACLAARLGEKASALELLRRTLDTEWVSRVVFEDPDLDVLRAHPEFEAIIGEVRRRLGGRALAPRSPPFRLRRPISRNAGSLALAEGASRGPYQRGSRPLEEEPMTGTPNLGGWRRLIAGIAMAGFVGTGTYCGSSPGSPSGSPAPEAGASACLVRANFGDPAESPYVLPYPVGTSYRIFQTYCGADNHGRDNQLAYDIEMPLESPILAARAGVVVIVFDTHLDSDAYDDRFNYIFIQHDDGTAAFYAHLRQHSSVVQEGESVEAGQHIADCGHLGNPITDLLHFGVYRTCCGGEDLPVNFSNAQGPLDARGGLLEDTFYLALPF